MTARSARHRLLVIPLVALATTIAACNAGAPPSSPPTNPPSSIPTPGPTASPTPTATPEVTPTPNPDLIPHPTGAHDIVLRMEEGGGFVPMGFFFTQSPTFTLYGDGTVIFKQVDNRLNSFNLPALPWLVGHLSEESVQALLQYALADGHLLDAKAQYDNQMVADAGNTIFTLNAAGQEKVVNIYALFESDMPGVPDAADRAAFWQLRQVLNAFETQEGLGEVEVYDAEWYRLLLSDGFGEPTGEVKDWPWDDLTLADFPAGDEPGGIANLDREHVALLMDVPNGGHSGVWAIAPDGEEVVNFGVRPLLPEEIEGAGLDD
ncbi:MAG TPA: hypothetical protein VMZ33_06250 [Candidatus Limnocylindrales bacterium]|nr:hypothetical protein [Candidatus Limnocylindrales bacterium]